jgi:hypothetical protein
MERPLIIILNIFLEMIQEFLEEEGYEVIILHENSTSLVSV